VPGATVLSAWGNKVRDRVINPFANAAARNSAITSPVEGMVAYLADVDRLCFYTGSVWAWVPGQVLARGNRATTSTLTTSEVGVLRLPVGSLVAGQTVSVKASPLFLYSSVAGDFVFAQIRYTTDGTTPSTASPILPGAQAHVRIDVAGVDVSTHIVTTYTPATAVNLTLLLTVSRSAGTGSVAITGGTVHPYEVVVTAMGTDPTDTGVDI
jgi:hypothetical protein